MSKSRKIVLSLISALVLMVGGIIAPAHARADIPDTTFHLGGSCVVNVSKLRIEGDCTPQFIGGALIASLAAIGVGLAGSSGSQGGPITPEPTSDPEPTTTVPTTSNPEPTSDPEPTTTVPTTTPTPDPGSNKVQIFRFCQQNNTGWARAVPLFNPRSGDTMRLYVNGSFSGESTTNSEGSLAVDDMTIGTGPVTLRAVATTGGDTFERTESFEACP